jgi:fatty acid desaturase
MNRPTAAPGQARPRRSPAPECSRSRGAWRLRNPKDGWCLAFLAVHPLVIAWHWRGGPDLVLAAVSCIMTYTVGCIQHCHGHTPFFRGRLPNRALEFLFTLYRGDGCLAWKATHNANHHRYANRPGDYTLTWRHSDDNNLIQFLFYLARGTRAYVRAAGVYLAGLLARRSPAGFFWLFQLAAYAALLGLLLARDPAATFHAVVVPQAFGLLAMIGTGYFQHHHTDENHPYDSARNFTGRMLNLVTFNHGYHLVHHLHINMHWTEWPREHARIRHRIAPELNQRSLAAYLLRIFVLQHFDARHRTSDFRARSTPA